jgi:hypothetical protein
VDKDVQLDFGRTSAEQAADEVDTLEDAFGVSRGRWLAVVARCGAGETDDVGVLGGQRE